MHAKRILMLLALVLLIAPAGCIFSPDEGGDGPPPKEPLPWPETQEQLMANFVTAYEKMDIDYYREVIHQDFRIYLSQQTIDDFDTGDYFDYDTEVQIARNMFSGNAITRDNGSIEPGITGFQFTYLTQATSWEPTPADDRIPNARRALYNLELYINRTEGAPRLRIGGGDGGQIEFYLRNIPQESQGRMRDRWWMVGQVDYTVGS